MPQTANLTAMALDFRLCPRRVLDGIKKLHLTGKFSLSQDGNGGASFHYDCARNWGEPLRLHHDATYGWTRKWEDSEGPGNGLHNTLRCVAPPFQFALR